MTEQGFKRKLSAILSADVEGYSRLMGDDEDATVHTLTRYRSAIADLVQQFRGRVVDAPGDNILADFASVVDALKCSVEIQRELAERNAGLPVSRKMGFRIGVNLGDVIEEDGRIYGDGVNIAARVESLSEAGGICISGKVYDHVENKLDYEYEYMGEQRVKNISKPVRLYRVRTKSTDDVIDLGKKLELPDKPSIAVLPFDNMSGDASQEFFSDGLTEQIITGISKIKDLFVIARNSSFTYRGKAVKVQQVARELGVMYVLEGSVQRSGNRVRINAQLVDAQTEHHIWAESYDRILEDIFAVQDDITIKLIEALQVKLIPGALYHHYGGRTENINAYFKFLQGMEYFYRMTAGDNFHAHRCFAEVIALDPNYSLSYSMLAYAHLNDIFQGWSKSPIESFEQAEKSAAKALSIDSSLDLPYIVLSQIYLFSRQHDKAMEHGERSVELNPNNALSYAMLALVLYFSGKHSDAISLMDKAFRLNPVAPFFYYHFLGHPHLMMENYAEAIKAYKKALHLNPNFIFPHLCLAACYIATGNDDAARKAVAEVLKLDPTYSSDTFSLASPHKDPANTEKLINLLRQAGLK
ncbi:Adenylate cyclase (EC [Olavius sp. associated proteobacterium Delta 1]|nr:Adenylate cyclase (EC [Olavius sp. associated proteobacterium Delta 1]